VVKLLPERQRGRRALVEASGNDRATRTGNPDGLVERRIGAGQLDYPVGARSGRGGAYGPGMVTMWRGRGRGAGRVCERGPVGLRV
jgi:hypothetical protein